MLTHRAPYPPDRGDRIRSYHLLRYLTERYQVHLGALHDEPVSDQTHAVLRELTADLALFPLGRRSRWMRVAGSIALGRSATEGLFASRALRSQVRAWARTVKFDAVFAFCSSMVQFAVVPELKGVPLIVDLVDVDSQKWFDYAASARGLKRSLFALEGRRVRRLERSLPERAAAITLVSEAEAEVFRGFCPNDKTLAVPNGVDLDYFSDQFLVAERRPNQCVFVGVLDYRANVESLVWFCREVWPRVIAQKPDAVFAIVGKNPAPAVKQLAQQPGVRLVGPVPDVRPYIAESRFVVAPLLIARGIQNKVLEAMAMGKPVIASPAALEGLGATPGHHLLIAKEATDWCDTVVRVQADEDIASLLGISARNFVERHHAWEATLRPLDDVFVSSFTSMQPIAKRRETGRRRLNAINVV